MAAKFTKRIEATAGDFRELSGEQQSDQEGGDGGRELDKSSQPGSSNRCAEDNQQQTDRFACVEESFKAGIALQRDDDDDRNDDERYGDADQPGN